LKSPNSRPDYSRIASDRKIIVALNVYAVRTKALKAKPKDILIPTDE
jgi:hypothetical protein